MTRYTRFKARGVGIDSLDTNPVIRPVWYRVFLAIVFEAVAVGERNSVRPLLRPCDLYAAVRHLLIHFHSLCDRVRACRFGSGSVVLPCSYLAISPEHSDGGDGDAERQSYCELLQFPVSLFFLNAYLLVFRLRPGLELRALFAIRAQRHRAKIEPAPR